MIYVINNKPYVKVQNFYAEVEVLRDRMVPVENFVKIYEEDIKKSNIKEYNSIEEYRKSKEISREPEKEKRIRIK